MAANDSEKPDPIKDLSERMKRADWWHDYSDDYEARARGRAEIDGIYKDLGKLRATNPEAVRDLWRQYAPKEWFRPRHLLTPEEERQAQAAEKEWHAARAEPDAKPSVWERGKEKAAYLRDMAAKLMADKKHDKTQEAANTRARSHEMER